VDFFGTQCINSVTCAIPETDTICGRPFG